MQDWMIYLIKVNLCLLFLYSFYRLFLKKETVFRLNRAYLLAGLAIALAIPALKFNLPKESIPAVLPRVAWKTIVPQKKTPKATHTLDVKQVAKEQTKLTFTKVRPLVTASPTAVQAKTTTFDWYRWGGLLYIAGIVVAFGIFLFRLWQIMRTIYRAKSMPQPGYKVVYTYGKLPMLSFFNYLFWDNTLKLTPEQKQQIITHETAHIRQWHTIDILLLELFCILFWYNPIIYWWRSALRENHEFLADEAVVQKQSAHSYALLLLNQSLGSLPQYALGNRLVQSQIKKRIDMMTKKTMHRKTYWKYLLLVPLLAGLGIGFSQISYGQKPVLAASHLLANKMTPQKLLAKPEAGKVSKEEAKIESAELAEAKAVLKDAIKRKIYEELQQLRPLTVVDSPIVDNKKSEMRRIKPRRRHSVYINGKRDRHYRQMDSGRDYVYLEATVKGIDYEVRYDKKGNVKSLYVDGKKIKSGKYKKYQSTTDSMWQDWIDIKEGLKDLSVSLKGLGKDLSRSLRTLNRDLVIDLGGILDGIRVEPFVDFGLDVSKDVMRNLRKEMKYLKKDLKREFKNGSYMRELREALKELRNLKFDIEWDDNDDD
ncbi:MAG TPA: hypothetical protein DCS93_12005 [Microscillaceae bacterium]|nr:hypothetical protein [Microscillaceae bacterium]